jgi:hypothetical protein
MARAALRSAMRTYDPDGMMHVHHSAFVNAITLVNGL